MSTSSPTFFFKNNGHATSLSEKLLWTYKEQEFFDTVIVAGSDCIKIPAHRIVLSAFSMYFLRIFRENQTTSSDNLVEIKDIEPNLLKQVIEFMYSGWIELNLKNVKNLLQTALFLEINDLIDGCCDYIEKYAIKKTNCIKWLSVTRELNLRALQEIALSFIYRNFQFIWKEQEFMLLTEMELIDLLFHNNPYGDFEEHIFLAILTWVRYDEENRKHRLLPLLSMVRYKYIMPVSITRLRKSLGTMLELYELICSWLQWHLSPKKFDKDEEDWNLRKRTIDKRVAVIGELKSGKMAIQTYNYAQESWFIHKNIPIKRDKLFSSMIVIGDILIIVGGYCVNYLTKSTECLHLRTLQTTDFPPMQYARSSSHLANLNGSLAVVGGSDKHGNLVDSMEIFDFSTNKWLKHRLSIRSKYFRIAVHNGNLYIIDIHGILECYDSSSKELTSESIGNIKRFGFGFAAVGGFLYIIGGQDDQKQLLNSVLRYDLCNDSWWEVTALPQARSNMETTVLCNKIVISDVNSKDMFIEEYNCDMDMWRSLNPLPSDKDYSSFICTVSIKV